MSDDNGLARSGLDAVLASAWRRLTEAANGHAAFRHFSISTIDEDGRPQSRMVVLRDADADAWRLQFQTDIRSQKVLDLQRDPRIAALFWDSEQQMQLRATGSASVHPSDDPAVADIYSRIPEAGRGRYRARQAPGTTLADPGDYSFESAGADDPGLRHFGVVWIAVQSLDVLLLEKAGHRRAVFSRMPDDSVARQRWIAP